MKSPWLLEYLLNLDVLLACVPCVSLAVRRAMKREREDIIDIWKGSILCGAVSSIVSIRVLLEWRWWICPERRSHSRINSERLHSTSPMRLYHIWLFALFLCVAMAGVPVACSSAYRGFPDTRVTTISVSPTPFKYQSDTEAGFPDLVQA